jgi:tetratricopeptide (TPR) repeat protein
MNKSNARLLVTAGILSLVGGCATGHQASLDIRSRDHVQATPVGERSIEHGKVLLRRGQYADAVSAFRTALREETEDAEAHNGLAVAYDAIGRKDLARRYFELAVAEKPGEIRYRSNLASFFEGNGQPELAFGLRDAPVAFAMAEVAIPAPGQITVADQPSIADAAQALDADPIATILPDLAAMRFEQETSALIEVPERNLAVVELSNKNSEPLISQVFRPSVRPMIKAVQISLPSLPIPVPQRSPVDGQFKLVTDLPRNDRRVAASAGPYIERVSLGEVKLVTTPLTARNELAFDFDTLGPKLALWAADEARQAELRKAPGLQGRTAIQNAIKRAAADAGARKSTSLAAVVQQLQREFVYITYDDQETIADTQA